MGHMLKNGVIENFIKKKIRKINCFFESPLKLQHPIVEIHF